MRTLTLAFLVALVCDSSRAQTVYISNRTDDVTYLWFKPQSAENWKRPPLELVRDERAKLNLESKSMYYLVVRRPRRKDKHIGHVDFQEIVRRARMIDDGSIAKVKLNEFLQTEQRTRAVNVMKTRTETRTRTVSYIVYVQEWFIGRFGNRFLRTVPQTQQREESYQVIVPYTEQVEHVYTVQVPRFEISVEIGGKDYPISDFVKK